MVDGIQHGFHGLHSTLGHDGSTSSSFIPFVNHVKSTQGDHAFNVSWHFVGPGDIVVGGLGGRRNLPDRSSWSLPIGSFAIFQVENLFPIILVWPATVGKRPRILAVLKVCQHLCSIKLWLQWVGWRQMELIYYWRNRNDFFNFCNV